MSNEEKSATVHTLPVWKKGSTPAEWLQEIAALALEKPERFHNMIVIFEEVNQKGHSTSTRYHVHGIKSNTELVGALEYAKQLVISYMKQGK